MLNALRPATKGEFLSQIKGFVTLISHANFDLCLVDQTRLRNGSDLIISLEFFLTELTKIAAPLLT